MKFIKPEDLLSVTSGGLDILIMLFPNAEKCVGTTKKFKIRGHEKSASATIKQAEDGNWLITDFGGDSKPRNAIGWYQELNKLSWVDALNELAIKFNIVGQDSVKEVVAAEVSKRQATAEEKDGDWFYDIRETLEDFEIENIVAEKVLAHLKWNTPEKITSAYPKIVATFKKYNFYSLVSYAVVKNREVITFSAHEKYPIFIIDEFGTTSFGEKYNFKKIYQPRSADKGFRFMYLPGGIKPKTFVHGLSQAQKTYNKNLEELQASEDFEIATASVRNTMLKDVKHDEFILASGGSDAINLALLGYWVGWMNSETAEFSEWHFKAMQKIAKEVYQLQDIDETGKKSAHINAMKYLDLRTIDLPDWLLKKRDKNLNFCKDVRDFFLYANYFQFKELVKSALPYRFWEMNIEFSGRGDSKNAVGYKPVFDNVQAYNFLAKNGFYRMPFEGKKQEYVYVQIDGNIVREVKPNRVKNFIHNFAEERQFDKELRNMLYKTTQLNEGSLSNLPEIELDFLDNNEKKQFFFFENCTIEVTADKINKFEPGVIKRYVWEKNVMEHVFKEQEAPFKITNKGDGIYDIEIINSDCFFLKYLINASRVHWQTELEDNLASLSHNDAEAYRNEHRYNIAGPNLTIDQRQEQKMHLINKLFVLGYLLHRHKDPSKSWAVIAMDNKLNDDGGSHGGSGKSIMLQRGMQQIWKKTFTIAGTNPKITENPHIYGSLTEHHQYIYMDDMDQYMKFRFFYDLITSEVVCNPKQADLYTLAFNQVGKVAITTNFTLRDQSPSSVRRTLYAAFSDYYHDRGENGEYQEDRSPATEFGFNLFSDFNKAQYNDFYNTMINCCQFFMTTDEKIGPPMDNVRKRNLQGLMGLNFENWAGVYFSEEAGNIDRLIIKQDAIADFNTKNKLAWTTQRFSGALKAFVQTHNYSLNPPDLLNTKDRRIIYQVHEEVYIKGEGYVKSKKATAKEFIYIQTNTELPLNVEVPGREVEATIIPQQPGTNFPI